MKNEKKNEKKTRKMNEKNEKKMRKITVRFDPIKSESNIPKVIYRLSKFSLSGVGR